MTSETPLPRLLREHPGGAAMKAILDAALRAVDPAACTRKALGMLGASNLRAGEVVHSVDPDTRFWILGAGKASETMAATLVDMFGERVAGGVVIVKHPRAETLGPVRVLAGDHPLPGPRSIASTQALLEVASKVGEKDIVLAPISGGASALLCEPTIALDELRERTANMLASGAAIEELNEMRREVDRIKGGGLRRLLAPARVVGLVLSDVPGDRLSDVGSGPTVNPKGPRHDVLVGKNADAREAAALEAAERGFQPTIVHPGLRGPADAAGRDLAEALAADPSAFPLPLPACLIAGGETTVRVQGSGRGGRNTELALAAAMALEGRDDVLFATLATDGEDGPSGAAGAVVDGSTVKRGRDAGLDPATALADNDSASFLRASGDLLVTGPTGTNVCDLALGLRFA